MPKAPRAEVANSARQPRPATRRELRAQGQGGDPRRDESSAEPASLEALCPRTAALTGPSWLRPAASCMIRCAHAPSTLDLRPDAAGASALSVAIHNRGGRMPRPVRRFAESRRCRRRATVAVRPGRRRNSRPRRHLALESLRPADRSLLVGGLISSTPTTIARLFDRAVARRRARTGHRALRRAVTRENRVSSRQAVNRDPHLWPDFRFRFRPTQHLTPSQ